MANREVAIAVSGVLVGVLLGASSVITARDSSLNAQLDDELSYLIDVDRTTYGKRAATQRVLGAPPLSGTELVAPRAAAPTTTVTVVAPSVLECAAIEALRDAILYVLPTRRENLSTVATVQMIFDDMLEACILGQAVLEEKLMPAAPTIRSVAPACLDPDYCYRYTRTRRTHCLVEQAQGICYQPGQISR